MAIDAKKVLDEAEALLGQEQVKGKTVENTEREEILSAVRTLFVLGKVRVQEIGPHTRSAFLVG